MNRTNIAAPLACSIVIKFLERCQNRVRRKHLRKSVIWLHAEMSECGIDHGEQVLFGCKQPRLIYLFPRPNSGHRFTIWGYFKAAPQRNSYSTGDTCSEQNSWGMICHHGIESPPYE